MNRIRNISFFLLLFIVLAGCGSSPVIKPTVLRDAESYTNAGMQAFEEADWLQAKRLFSRALLLYQGIDDQQGVLSSHINLSEVALSVHDHPEVNKNLIRASDLAKNAKLQQYQTRITLLNVQSALQQNEIPQAKNTLQPILPEFDGDTLTSIPDIIQLTAIANRTKIAFLQKQEEALWTKRYANALEMMASKNYSLTARLLRFQSALLQQQGNYEDAESNLQQALLEYKKNLFRPGIAQTLLELGQFYMAQVRWKEAESYLNRSVNVFRYLEDLDKVNQVTENIERVEMELGKLESSKVFNLNE